MLSQDTVFKQYNLKGKTCHKHAWFKCYSLQLVKYALCKRF